MFELLYFNGSAEIRLVVGYVLVVGEELRAEN